MGCLGTPGDTRGDTGAGEERPIISPSLLGNGDSFDGLCIEWRESVSE